MITQVTGVLAGLLLARHFRTLPALVRAAVFAQIADLVTFALVWNDFQEEMNPLASLVLGTVHAGLADVNAELASWLAAAVLMTLKIALIAYLVWAAPLIGRYRRPVLVVALAAGVLGALSNARLLGIFIGPGNVPLLG